jgi:hypothetical protein
VAVLPYCFDNDQGGVRRNLAEDIHPVFLRVNKAMLLGGIYGVTAFDLETECFDSSGDSLFDLLLGRPADTIRGEAQIAAGDHDYAFRHRLLFWQSRKYAFAGKRAALCGDS